MTDQPFDDPALRAIIDLRDAYEASLDIWRDHDAHEGSMQWRNRADRQYLYHRRGSVEQSLGPRNAETESTYQRFRARKAEIRQMLAATQPDLHRAAAVYVAMGLPVIDSWAAKLSQHLDREGLMGPHVMVVGTNAMPAYQIEAQQRTGQRMYATRDVDLAWCGEAGDSVLWPSLREFAPDFTLNQERPFQARTAARREIELLVAPSKVSAAAKEPFKTVPLPEQEWLLNGEPLRHVVAGLDRTPAAIVVPDPRWFALQKAWLSEKPERDPLKRPKDRAQSERLWAWLCDGRMPRYALDDAFRDSVPAELQAKMRELDRGIGLSSTARPIAGMRRR